MSNIFINWWRHFGMYRESLKPHQNQVISLSKITKCLSGRSPVISQVINHDWSGISLAFLGRRLFHKSTSPAFIKFLVWLKLTGVNTNLFCDRQALLLKFAKLFYLEIFHICAHWQNVQVKPSPYCQYFVFISSDIVREKPTTHRVPR